MAEYIDRDAIYKAFANACTDVLERVSEIYYIAGFSYEHVIEILDDIPAADVAPVRQGHWELTGADKYGRGGIWKCTGRDGCGKFYPYKCDFCPNCGAKMDGVEEREK